MIENTKRLVARAEAHAKADRYRQDFGYFYKIDKSIISVLIGKFKRNKPGSYKGCAIGCLAMPTSGFARFLEKHPTKFGESDRLTQETSIDILRQEFGIPSYITESAERFFETLPWKQAQKWPVRFAKALREGTKPGYFICHNYNRAEAKRFLQHLREAPKISS